MVPGFLSYPKLDSGFAELPGKLSGLPDADFARNYCAG